MHVGALLGNSPAMLRSMAAAALGGYVLCGINTTRRGDGLAGRHQAGRLPTGARRRRAHAAARRARSRRRDRARRRRARVPRRGRGRGTACAAPRSRRRATPSMMIFTSGTSGDPKAVRFAHAMAVLCGASLAERFELTADDVCYLSMPLFHSNGVAAGWAVAIGMRRDDGAREVLAVAVPARHPPLRRHLHELRRQAAGAGAGHAREARRRRQHAAGGVRQRGHRARHRRVRTTIRMPGRGQLRLERVRRRRDARGRHARRDRSARGIRVSACTTRTP